MQLQSRHQQWNILFVTQEVILDNRLKEFDDNAKETDGDEHQPAFLKIGHKVDTIHKFRKHFSLRKRLNKCNKIGNNSGLRFLRTIKGVLTGPVAFV